MNKEEPLQIGWATRDITPKALPVLIAGQFHIRVSEGVDDPLFATALALGSGEEEVTFVGCDLVGISKELMDAVRSRLRGLQPGPDPEKVILHATHTHTGPEIRLLTSKSDLNLPDGSGVELNIPPPPECVEFLADQIVDCIRAAWAGRKPGRVAFGLDAAVVGRNRRWVDSEGRSTMYGLNSHEARERFRHIEGCEDPSLNLLATYDEAGALTGVLINLPSPSQENEQAYRLSADFWHETREALRGVLGEGVFILPQCSSAGDLTSHLLFEKEAHERMLRLRGRTARQEIASRIAGTVGRILPAIAKTAEPAPKLRHDVSYLELPANRITAPQAETSRQEAAHWKGVYEEEKRKLEADPALREPPRWYRGATQAFRKMNWLAAVADDYEKQQNGEGLTQRTEVHVVRLGEIAFASNPFELYLDFGHQIKVRSPSIQTFLIQLAGRGTYVPSPRSVRGGGYGSVPANTPVGAEGGQLLAEHTVETLRGLFSES